MTQAMVLDRQELESLTHRTRSSAQVRALRFMGIEHRIRPDGTVAVLRTHVEVALGANQSENKGNPANEPNWAGISGNHHGQETQTRKRRATG